MNKLSWLWAIVPLVGLAELLGHSYFSTRPPSVEDWALVREPILELRSQQELIVVAPYWAEPNARRVLGDDLMPLSDVARPDEARYPRAIELSILGQSSELEWPEVSRKQVGKFRLRLLENPNHEPVHLDFVDRVHTEQVEVSTRTRGKNRLCRFNPKARVRNGALHGHPTFPRKRYECGDGSWHFVGVTVIEDQHYRPKRCIWAHPARRKHTVIRFKDVLLHHKIHGYGALPYFLERESSGSPVKLEIRVDDEKLGTFTHRDGESWRAFEFSTKQFNGKKATVEFRVSAKRAAKREFCFQADIR